MTRQDKSPEKLKLRKKLAEVAIPEELVIGRRMTIDQWRAGRRIRREISDLISPEECGQDTSDDDALLRAHFNGRRNLPFTPTEDLPGVSLYDLIDKQSP